VPCRSSFLQDYFFRSTITDEAVVMVLNFIYHVTAPSGRTSRDLRSFPSATHRGLFPSRTRPRRPDNRARPSIRSMVIDPDLGPGPFPLSSGRTRHSSEPHLERCSRVPGAVARLGAAICAGWHGRGNGSLIFPVLPDDRAEERGSSKLVRTCSRQRAACRTSPFPCGTRARARLPIHRASHAHDAVKVPLRRATRR
jgi:hypothetical protein